MHLRKKEYPLPRIKLLKRRGSIEWVTGMFFLLFLVLLLCTQLQIEMFCAASLYMEDALAASNLASAVIDIEEYGVSHAVKIKDVEEAFRRYQNALKENLQLNAGWECDNQALIAGVVIIEQYIVYNVENEGIQIVQVSSNGSVSTSQGMIGSVRAPNGVLITDTAVYSEISFPVKGLWGISQQARKGKLVDVVASGAE